MAIKIPKLDKREYLLNKKHPNAFELKRYDNGYHGNKVTYNEEYIATLKKDVDEYMTLLNSYDGDMIQGLYNIEYEKAKEEQEAKHFYHKTHADADFIYWSKMQEWSIEEGIALIHGKDPKTVNYSSLKRSAPLSDLRKQFDEIIELAKRSVKWKKLYDPALPSLFIKWAKDNGFEAPLELDRQVLKRKGNTVDWKKQYDDLLKLNNGNVGKADKLIADQRNVIDGLKLPIHNKSDLNTKEKTSLLKILLGLTLTNYEYNPNASRNSTAREIASDLELQGLSVDEDTIRKWLNQSKEYLPDTWGKET